MEKNRCTFFISSISFMNHFTQSLTDTYCVTEKKDKIFTVKYD